MATATITVRLFLLVLSSRLLAEVCPSALAARNAIARKMAPRMDRGDKASLDALREAIAQNFTTKLVGKRRTLLPAAAAVVKQIETYQRTGKLPAGLR